MSKEDAGIAAAIGTMTTIATAIIGLVKTLESAGTLPNIPFPTMGGKVFWSTIEEKDGWKVQKNTFTQHCRVLDPKNIRRAWGYSEEALLAELKKLANPTSENT